MNLTLADCETLDAQDPLAPLRAQFHIPDGLVYLDGNSLGVLPRATPGRVAHTITQDWGQGLIRSWNQAGWFELPRTLGDKLAPLVGARAGELVVADSTSLNLYKVLAAALSIAAQADRKRLTVLSERDNFPTDLYIAQSLVRQHGGRLLLVDSPAELETALEREPPAVLMLTQVNYRTGYLHDMAALTARAHAAGALAVWDLAHSAGALPVDLHGADADFAVGCGYKYLNGGPGAPAFAWVHPRHAGRFEQPLSGWWGHAQPFAFSPDYRPAEGIARYLCGTQPVLAMVALECGLDTVLAAQPLGGMAALRAKSQALTELFIQRVEARCAGHGLRLVTPREPARRGSQVCFAHAEHAYTMVQALIARDVVGDFRAPDILRFGFTPLYLGFADVWRAVERLAAVLEGQEWRRPEFQRPQAVT